MPFQFNFFVLFIFIFSLVSLCMQLFVCMLFNYIYSQIRIFSVYTDFVQSFNNICNTSVIYDLSVVLLCRAANAVYICCLHFFLSIKCVIFSLNFQARKLRVDLVFKNPYVKEKKLIDFILNNMRKNYIAVTQTNKFSPIENEKSNTIPRCMNVCFIHVSVWNRLTYRERLAMCCKFFFF